MEAGLRCWVMVALVLALLPGSARAAGFVFDQAPGMLAKTVVPLAYRIAIDVHLRKPALAGRETVTVDVRKPVHSITLNQAGLVLHAAVLDHGDHATITEDAKAQTATLHFAHEVPAGRHTLAIDYAGPIPETPSGIYYNDYKGPHGHAHRMLVTQFEVGDARKMFPGWDEPAFKATFNLTVTLRRGLTAISNMPVATTTLQGGDRQRVAFATTPRMSTYLLALVAGHLAAVHGSAGPVNIAVWAPVGEQDQGNYALHAAEKILPYYAGYFHAAYPLPKLDLIAIPGNFQAGAMENWGAITFIDNSLLFDKASSSPRTREDIYLTVSHEMAHQWVGDLVTMGWWNDIWLNEGFATWMEAKATAHFNPGWQMMTRQHSAREIAMATDALATTHPIEQPIGSISEANAAFDSITYLKGGLVIRMVENWLGPAIFRAGMRNYIKAHEYGSAASGDLWAALDAASGRNVGAVATSFTRQKGIPLVQVLRVCADGRTRLTLSQSRFVINHPHAAKLVWQIPVVIGGPGIATQTLLLGAAPATLDFAGCDAVLKANLGEGGYYRTRYDHAGLAALEGGFGQLQPVDQADLLGDQFALFAAGQAPLADYLDLVGRLRGLHEASYTVWLDTVAHLEGLDRLERHDAQRPAFRAFARQVLAPEMARLGWTPRAHESFLDTLLRPEIIEALGEFGDKAIIRQADARFATFIKTPASLPPSLIGAVAGIVGHHADLATWKQLRALGEAAPDTERKLRYFTAMAAARDKTLVARSVAFATSGQIPNGRIVQYLATIAYRSGHPGLVWKLVQTGQKPILARLAPWSRTYLLPVVASATLDDTIAKAMLADKASTASAGAKLQAAKYANQIETGVKLRHHAQHDMAAWLARQA